MRIFLVSIKLLLNILRPIINIYNLILAISPFKILTAKLLGSICAPSAKVTGRLSLNEPAWFQMNRDSRAGSIIVRKNGCLLLDNNCLINDIDVSSPAIFTSKNSYIHHDRPIKTVTISIDLEGGVGLSHASARIFKKLQPQWNSYQTALALHSLFKKYSLPVTWAMCGHLFLDSCDGGHGFIENDWYGDWFTFDPKTSAESNPDWYMPGFVKLLKEDTTAEIAYHSFGHFNYCNASNATILKDLQWANHIRKQYNISLKTLVYPYNAVSHIEEALQCGFRFFRGYIGQYYLPVTVDFGSFTFYGTSMFVGPGNVKKRIQSSNECIGKNFNYFLHPENWVGCTLELFEQWCNSLFSLREKGLINISILGNNESK
jgi:hypothetical protein